MNSWMDHIGWETTIAVWHLPVLLILSVLLLWWEISKKKPRKYLRIISLGVAIISLYSCYLSPFYKSKAPLKSVVLIGSHIPQDLLDSLRQQKQYPVILQDEQNGFKPTNGKPLPTLDALEFSIDTLFAVGHLPHYNPSLFNHFKRLPTDPDGLQLQFPTAIQLGDSLKVEISHPSGLRNKLKVNFNRDSVILQASRSERSNISYLPKQTGAVLVNLQQDSLHHLNFSVEVKAAEHDRIMLMAAVPDFEWRFLANYLMEEGHAVYQYTQISKDKFKSAFFNWPDSVAVKQAIPQQLDRLIIDAIAWDDLGASQRQQYLNLLSENSGALIIRSNSNTRISLNLGESKLTNIFSSGENLIKTNNLKTLEIREINGLEEVVKNQLYRKMNANLVVGIINFQNSFQLKLSGEEKQFRQLWQQVFSELRLDRTARYHLQDSWPVQFQPFQIQLWSAAREDSILIISPKQDSVSISSISDPVFTERKHFQFYPTQIGWHFWKFKDSPNLKAFHVHAKEQSTQSIFSNDYDYQYQRQLNSLNPAHQKISSKYQLHSLTIWFFMLFLVSIGILWLEDKIN